MWREDYPEKNRVRIGKGSGSLDFMKTAETIGGDSIRTLLFWDTSAGTENPLISF